MTRPPETQLRRTDVQPPTALYVGPGEQLHLSHFASIEIPIELTVRLLRADNGEVQYITETWTTVADRTIHNRRIRLAEGFVLAMNAQNFTAAIQRGEVWLSVVLLRGEDVGVESQCVLQGYVTGRDRLTWPGGRVEQSTEGRGAIRSITGTNPAADTEIDVTVPLGALWRLIAVQTRLVTDANVANRVVRLAIDDGTNYVHIIEPPTPQTASLTREYNWAVGMPIQAPVFNGYILPLPDGLYLREGWGITTLTVNRQAGDDFSAPQIVVEEWLAPVVSGIG